MSTISFLPLERVYDGVVGGSLPEKSRLLLRIESNGTVHGEVRMSARILANGKKRKRQIADLVVAHIIGNAQVVPPEQAVVVSCTSTVCGNGPSLAEYCCGLAITKRLNHVDRHTLTCHLHVPVAPNAPAVGTWQWPHAQDCTLLSSPSTVATKNIDTSLEKGAVLEQKLFQLQPVQSYECQPKAEEGERETAMSKARLSSLLYPLRPGKYEFRGFTTKSSSSVASVPRQRRRGRSRPVLPRAKEECLVTLHLLPDGTLRGTSREVVQPQVCPLSGRWHANRVAYVLEYHVREAVGHFRYAGAVVNKRKTQVDNETHETLSGKWYNVDEGHAEGFEGGRGEFELALVRVDYTPILIKTKQTRKKNQSKPAGLQRIDQDQRSCTGIELDDNDDVICAFTTGAYELSGCATDAEGYEYAFTLHVQLHSDGKLCGECNERIFHQTRPVFGCWTPSRLLYSQEYVVKHEVGIYTYVADMSTDGAVVRGAWTNTEAEAAVALSEHGTVALLVVRSVRTWSATSHVHYPFRFRRGVLATLMASARSHLLPGALWTHVFGFCSEQWFTSPQAGVESRVPATHDAAEIRSPDACVMKPQQSSPACHR